MSFTSSFLGLADAGFGLFGRIIGMFGRLVGRLAAIAFIGVLCMVGYIAYTLRLDLWHHQATGLLVPLFVFAVVFCSSSLLVLNEKSRAASGMLIGALAYITLHIGASAFAFEMPKTATGLKIRAEQFDQKNLISAKADLVETQHALPSCLGRKYFGTNELTGEVVVLIGYTRTRTTREVRCFDISKNPTNPGVDPESGETILPITPNVLEEVKEQIAVAATPELTLMPVASVQVAQAPITTPEPVATERPLMTFRVFIKETILTTNHPRNISGKTVADIMDKQGVVLIKRGKKINLDPFRIEGVPGALSLVQFRIIDERLPNVAISDKIAARSLWRLARQGDDQIQFREQIITFKLSP